MQGGLSGCADSDMSQDESQLILWELEIQDSRALIVVRIIERKGVKFYPKPKPREGDVCFVMGLL
jgi:hypothetical protein